MGKKKSQRTERSEKVEKLQSVCLGGECERKREALPQGMISLPALGEGRLKTASCTAEDVHWQLRSTSGFVIMKCSRLQTYAVQRGETEREGGSARVVVCC